MGHSLLGDEQVKALTGLSQRERIDVILRVLIRRMERDARVRAFDSAIEAVQGSDMKSEALKRLTQLRADT